MAEDKENANVVLDDPFNEPDLTEEESRQTQRIFRIITVVVALLFAIAAITLIVKVVDGLKQNEVISEVQVMEFAYTDHLTVSKFMSTVCDSVNWYVEKQEDGSYQVTASGKAKELAGLIIDKGEAIRLVVNVSGPKDNRTFTIVELSIGEQFTTTDMDNMQYIFGIVQMIYDTFLTYWSAVGIQVA